VRVTHNIFFDEMQYIPCKRIASDDPAGYVDVDPFTFAAGVKAQF
jgi:hypothetical protein